MVYFSLIHTQNVIMINNYTCSFILGKTYNQATILTNNVNKLCFAHKNQLTGHILTNKTRHVNKIA